MDGVVILEQWHFAVIGGVIGILIAAITYFLKRQITSGETKDAQIEVDLKAVKLRVDTHERDLNTIKANCVQHNRETLTESRLRQILKEELPLQFENFKNNLYKDMFEKEYIKPKPNRRKP